jgi:hypothetical protein
MGLAANGDECGAARHQDHGDRGQYNSFTSHAHVGVGPFLKNYFAWPE